MGEKEILEQLFESVLKGNLTGAADAAQKSLDANISPLVAIEKGMTPAIKKVGDAFGIGEMFLPEMVASAGAMEAALEILEPFFEGDEGSKKA
jgi:monomethylamine corrinoid protein